MGYLPGRVELVPRFKSIQEVRHGPLGGDAAALGMEYQASEADKSVASVRGQGRSQGNQRGGFIRPVLHACLAERSLTAPETIFPY